MSAAIASGYLAAFPPSLEVNADVAQGHGWPVVEHQQYAMQGVIANDCMDAGGRQKTAPAFSAFATSLWFSTNSGALGDAGAVAEEQISVHAVEKKATVSGT
jgi:hypothetical protein